MTYERTEWHEGRGRDADVGPGERVEFPSSAALRELIRLRRKRAADRPAIEAFKRGRLEAHRRILASVEKRAKAG